VIIRNITTAFSTGNPPKPDHSKLRRLLAKSVPPLHEALWIGDNQLAKAILDRGADSNEAQPGAHPAKTPLMIAAYKGNVEAVGLLLARGANPGVADERGETAADFASGADKERILKLLSTSSTQAN